jgi:periplasmic divalent cation tolerance protein
VRISKGKLIIVLVTLPDEASAETMSRELVEKRLAACVSRISGITSLYRWKGEFEESKETLLLVKTRAELYDELEHEIRASHPYTTPEIVALSATEVLEDYFAWVGEETLARASNEREK